MKQTTWSFRWRDREVNSLVGRIVVTLLGVAGAVVGIVGVAISLVVVIPLAILVHPLFWLFGLQGTVRHSSTSLHIGLDREAFRKGSKFYGT